ncbi:RraA family protein [Parahaliea mediterranea]|uniref:RraA family protein n=1 Tax=Parahaliea mediterranea TaxID=651086 RepID=UPI0013008A2E|nr:RraA family protein [Parahaliea mediterranea]
MNTTNALVARLQKLESAVVADVMDTMGLEHQVPAPGLLPVRRHSTMAGPVICAAGSDTVSEGLPTFALDDAIYPGGILVIDTDQCSGGAIIGDNMVTSMVNRGAAGFIVDGGIRDAAEFEQLEQPVFYRYTSPLNAHKYWRLTAVEQPITLPGVRGPVNINPGDLLLADADGIVVLPIAHAAQIIADAEIHLATENSIKQGLVAGGDRKTVTQAAGRLKHVQRLG